MDLKSKGREGEVQSNMIYGTVKWENKFKEI